MRLFCLLLLVGLCSTTIVFSQTPYITTGPAAGLGNYGYLEMNAVTYASLNRNTYGNIDFLSARFWVTDNQLPNPTQNLYHTYSGPDGNWGCNDGVTIKRTADYNPADFNGEWAAGSDVYVSVFSKVCPVGTGAWGPAFPDGSATGFNERQFKVLDVSSASHTSVTNIVGDGNGNCNAAKVVGTFVIDPGNSTVNLTRLRIRNTGTALETVDIHNAGFRLFYEPVTGMEVYDGVEASAGELYGNWNADPANNNYYENASLNIPVTGAVRVYVLLCNLETGFTANRTINLSIDNDGLNFSPLINTSFGLMRIDELNITNDIVILPNRFTSFSGLRKQDHYLINGSVVQLQQGEKVALQKRNGLNEWNNLQTYQSFDQGKLEFSYADVQHAAQPVYYRLQLQQKGTGNYIYSHILRLEPTEKKKGVRLYREALSKGIYLESFTYSGIAHLQWYDANGRLLKKTETKNLLQGQKLLLQFPDESLGKICFLKLLLQDGTQQFLKAVN